MAWALRAFHVAYILSIIETVFKNERIVTCYLLTRRIICGLRIFYLDLLDITSGGVYNHL
jgi:hypothetical protein